MLKLIFRKQVMDKDKKKWTKVDEASLESFPASDPPAFIYANHQKETSNLYQDVSTAKHSKELLNLEIVCDLVKRLKEILHTSKNSSVPIKQEIDKFTSTQKKILSALILFGFEKYKTNEWEKCLAQVTQEKEIQINNLYLNQAQILHYLVKGLKKMGFECD